MPDTPVRASVDVKVGKKTIDKVTDAILDLISPGTEYLGALGDAVRLGRIETAAKVIRRTKEIADECGLKLVAPPLKFLVPFLEKASLEEDRSLEELWAGLMASSCAVNQTSASLYTSILSSMSAEHANMLQFMYRSSMANFENSFSVFNIDRIEYILQEAVRDCSSDDFEGQCLSMAKHLMDSGIAMTNIYVDPDDASSTRTLHLYSVATDIKMLTVSVSDTVERVDMSSLCEISLQALRHYGLVQLENMIVKLENNYTYGMQLYTITRMGTDFLQKCKPSLRL